MSLSNFLLAFFLCVICLFLFFFFPLGCSFTEMYFCLSFFPLGCIFTAVFRSWCLALLLSFRSACDHSFVFLSVFRVCLVRDRADLTRFLLTVLLSTFRRSICIVLFSYCFNEIRRI